jgi:hypothetical protein
MLTYKKYRAIGQVVCFFETNTKCRGYAYQGGFGFGDRRSWDSIPYGIRGITKKFSDMYIYEGKTYDNTFVYVDISYLDNIKSVQKKYKLQEFYRNLSSYHTVTEYEKVIF